MAKPLQVEVVSSDGLIWEGEAVSVIVRATEGELGVLSGHEPLLTALVPSAAEVVTVDGRREVIAVEGGFLSVFENRVSLLSDFATMAGGYSLEDARRELASMREEFNAAALTDEEQSHYNRLVAQVKAGEKYEELRR